jgi:hypothetical protein
MPDGTIKFSAMAAVGFARGVVQLSTKKFKSKPNSAIHDHP